jgi:hypothetical protein
MEATIQIDKTEYNALRKACQHAAMSNHHPACKCKGEKSAFPEQHCTCHVQKARAALEKGEVRG